ncbi:hypothetical protein ABKA04_005133 [Annulohypoxylon sp. FPYF3050]
MPAQKMSLTTSSDSAIWVVHNIPELLAKILSFCDNHDLLVNVQLVSKYFRDIIKGSPEVLFKLAFEQGSSEPGRVINRLLNGNIPFYLLKSHCINQVMLIHPKRAYSILPPTIPRPMTQPLREGWFAPDASWRTMQVSDPQITTIHWRVINLADPNIPEHLPSSVIQIEVRNGLTMGDYLGLRIQTKGTHQETFPSDCTKRCCEEIPPPPNYPKAMFIHDTRMAMKEGALMITQTIPARIPTGQYASLAERGLSKSYWEPIDFSDNQAYHIKKVEDLRLVTDPDTECVLWEYKQLFVDPILAKKWFIANFFW